MSPRRKLKEKLDYIRCTWRMFPLYTLYATSDSLSLNQPYENCMFVYAIHKVSDVIPTKLDIESKFFYIYEFSLLGFTSPVGYAFIPKDIVKPWVIRYTPYVISVTNPEMTPEVVEASQKTQLFSTDYFELLDMSCGCEVLHDLNAVMGVDIKS